MDNKKQKNFGIEIKHEFHCTTPMQLRLFDLDTLGHVNNGVYFNLFDLAKSDYFEKVTGKPADPNNIKVLIANINCDFLAETLFNENIAVLTQTESIGEKSFKLVQALINTDTGQFKCICSQILVHFDPETRATSPVPQLWRDAISRFEQRPM